MRVRVGLGDVRVPRLHVRPLGGRHRSQVHQRRPAAHHRRRRRMHVRLATQQSRDGGSLSRRHSRCHSRFVVCHRSVAVHGLVHALETPTAAADADADAAVFRVLAQERLVRQRQSAERAG